MLDIVGGLVGTFFTGVLFVFIAPAIFISSPGPIFFKQERIGKNGKRFKILCKGTFNRKFWHS